MKTTAGFNLRSSLLAGALLAGLSCTSHGAANQAVLIDLNSRTATELGTLGGSRITGLGWVGSTAYGINDSGQVVGESTTAEGANHAFITGRNGVGMRDLGTLGGSSSTAYGINGAGQVVGVSTDAEGISHPFITGPNGVGMRDLGTLEGYSNSVARSINEAGQVAGWSNNGVATATHAFITGPDGMDMRDLGTLGGRDSHAFGINEAGQVVGESNTIGYGYSHAFITGPDGMGMRDLGTLENNFSIAYAINKAGQVVGQSSAADGYIHSFITGPDGMDMRDLGRLEFYGINDAGEVAGFSGGVASHAFITGPNGVGITDLNSLFDFPKGVTATYFNGGINNAGQVAVTAAIIVPEPESYALLLAGLVLIAAIVRPKKDTRQLPVPC